MEAPLRSPERVSFHVELGTGDYLQLKVAQMGVDVRVIVVDPNERRRLVVDGPNGTRGTESVSFLAEQTGEFRVEVQAADGGGTFQIHLVELRPATATDRLRTSAAAALAEGDRLRKTGGTEQREAAYHYYLEALAIWGKLEEPSQEAIAKVRIGQIWGARGDRKRQIECFEAALRMLNDKADSAQKSYVLLSLGTARREELDPEAALAAFEEALRFAQEVSDRAQEATALNNLALHYEMGGALERAAELFGEAMVRYREMGRMDWLGHSMANQAASYLLMGRLGDARELLAQADELYRHLRDDAGRAKVLVHLGWIAYLSEDWQQALEHYQEALKLSRSAAHRQWEASALDRRGTLYRVQGRREEARAEFEAALVIFRHLDKPLSVAHTTANLGWLALDTGDLDRAASFQAAALEGFQAAADSHGEAGALYLSGRIGSCRGDLHESLHQMDTLLSVIDSQRMEAQDQATRIAYLDLRFEYFEYYIGLLMALEKEEPGMGYAEAAFAAVERSRARSLLDQLTFAGVVREPLARIGLAQVQEELLEAGTVMLVYSLGRSQSFVWAVTSTSMAFHELPVATDLEQLAIGFHRSLSYGRSAGTVMQSALAASALSDQILTPVAKSLEVAERIVIVGDGALHLIPFAALPSPVDGRPLVQSHELVSIPSSSVMIALRKQATRTSSGVAVLADPPFTVGDPRVASSGTAAVAAAGFIGLNPLAYTKIEAEAILAHVPTGEPALKALGLAAQRDLVTSGALDAYRILHFATHGLLHTEHPELSGIVLSMFDPQGNPIDGTLRVKDVYELDLRAKLVVLSACETALGKRFQGEGVLGFPRAFMLIGVPRVVVSLWKVEDRATAELMSLFYHGVLVERLPPARALAQAQRVLAADSRWQDSHDWAAFVLQGDWR